MTKCLVVLEKRCGVGGLQVTSLSYPTRTFRVNGRFPRMINYPTAVPVPSQKSISQT